MNDKKFRFKDPGISWFIPAIICAIILARYFPEPGKMQGLFSLSELIKYGISGIFFFYGLKLNIEQLKKGINNWRLHLLIQTITFLIFPLIVLAIKPFFRSDELQTLWLGLFFLSALPSTVSSSVVMVSLANGNIPSAIFNASISAFIGMIITPLWITLFFQSSGIHFELVGLVLKLTLQVLIPVLAGILLNKQLGFLAVRYKAQLQIFDQIVILLIIYTSFCKSFSERSFGHLSSFEIIGLTVGMFILFLLVMQFCILGSGLLKLNNPDTITAIFCGSKKSLVHGSVMAGLLFPGNPVAGYILLPIMLYHAVQLIVSGFLVKNIGQILSK